jgi:hypothetical protein
VSQTLVQHGGPAAYNQLGQEIMPMHAMLQAVRFHHGPLEGKVAGYSLELTKRPDRHTPESPQLAIARCAHLKTHQL